MRIEINSLQTILSRLIISFEISSNNKKQSQMNKYELFIVTFLCYTAIHSLRTSYSFSKKAIAEDVEVNIKYMGIVDALMLCFLGIGHYMHAIRPIKRPVRSLFIAMIVCGLNYGLIPGWMNVNFLASIYALSVLMCINGFLQSYTWPNLLMIVNSRFKSEKYSMLLGFWSANANVGNIIGYAVCEVLNRYQYNGWQYALVTCGLYAIANGVYIGGRFDQLPTQPEKVSQSSIQQDSMQKTTLNNETIQSCSTLQDKLLEDERKKSREVQGESPLLQEKNPVLEVFKNPSILLLTITFSLAKSVIYGLMLWLPLYFKSKNDLKEYAAQIPIAYDTAAIFGSVVLGYLFKKIMNKGLLMIPFMVVLFTCFFFLHSADFEGVAPYFIIISVVGVCLGGIFNTLSGLVVIELIKAIPEQFKTSKLGFYSALTMAVGNITTALTQILIGFVIGKQNQSGIFLVFMIYASICLVCLIVLAIITLMEKGYLNKKEVHVLIPPPRLQNDSFFSQPTTINPEKTVSQQQIEERARKFSF